jgi:hypothetical protein
MKHRIGVSPSFAIGLLALFFALGGTALAVTKSSTGTPQARCAQGAVRGIAEVTGQVGKGVANVPDQFTAARTYFGRRFNCAVGAVEVRRMTTGIYDVLFVHNAASTALVSAMGSDAAGADVARSPDGTFRITLGTKGTPEDVPFTVVVF